MEKLTESSELRRIRSEQDRERRRQRDKQRRLAMTLEQREKHLARRRRSYQLRRLRARNVRIDASSEKASIVSRNEMTVGNENHLETSSTEWNGVSLFCSDLGQETLNAERPMYPGLEAVAHELTSFQRRVRLSHIRRVARSIYDTTSQPGVLQSMKKMITEVDAARSCMRIGEKNDQDSSRSPKPLRLNHVKHLARRIGSAVKESTGPKHQSCTEGSLRRIFVCHTRE